MSEGNADRARFPVRLIVEPGKATEFSRAVGLDLGEGAEHAPPTFTAVMDHFSPTIAEMMAEMGHDPRQVLHGEEAISVEPGGLRVGQQLRGVAQHVGTERKDGASGPLDLVKFEVELRTLTGELAIRIERTLVVLVNDEQKGLRA